MQRKKLRLSSSCPDDVLNEFELENESSQKRSRTPIHSSDLSDSSVCRRNNPTPQEHTEEYLPLYQHRRKERNNIHQITGLVCLLFLLMYGIRYYALSSPSSPAPTLSSLPPDRDIYSRVINRVHRRNDTQVSDESGMQYTQFNRFANVTDLAQSSKSFGFVKRGKFEKSKNLVNKV